MGIRFYCPNGHRLHVKSFLAGKRGICPSCSARFRIPEGSEIPRGSPKIRPDSPAAAGGGRGGNGKHGPVAAVVAAERPAIPTPFGSGPGYDLGASLGANLGASLSASLGGRMVDPIAEAPEAVWYVRPPSGGQYGPAKGDVMRRWIEEGRVSTDSLVWREGWPDWMTAGPVFPSLPNATAPRVAVSLNRETPPSPARSMSEPPAGPRSAAATARPPSKSLAAIIILVFVALVLVVALVVVLTTRS